MSFLLNGWRTTAEKNHIQLKYTKQTNSDKEKNIDDTWPEIERREAIITVVPHTISTV